jgi:YD repeat-containing protein
MDYYPQNVQQLNDAIIDMYSSTGPHTVHLDAGKSYVLTGPYLSGGATGTVAIGGSTSTKITIEGNNATLVRTSSSLFRLLEINLAEVTIKNLNFRNGYSGEGGSIKISGAIVTLDRCSFFSNYGGNGGAVNVFESTNTTIKNCYFENNTYGGYGGAIYGEEAIVTVLNSTFNDNRNPFSSSYGGAIAIYNNPSRNNVTPSLDVEGCEFNRNQSDREGGAIYLEGASAQVKSSKFYNNRVLDDVRGGTVFTRDGDLTISNQCDFNSNTAGGDGAAVYVLGVSANPTVQISQTTFRNNAAASGDTGGILNNASSNSVTVQDCVFANNLGYAVQSLASIINAANNFWSGIGGPSGFGNGSGDAVGDNVIYQPFKDPSGANDHEGAADDPCGSIGNDGRQTRNPISLRLGEKRVRHTDISVKTANNDLRFTRFYRLNQRDTNMGLGLGWSHNHAVSLTPPSGGTIIVRFPTGTVKFDYDSGTSRYEGAAGATSYIEQESGTNDYILTYTDQSTYRFDSTGKLLERTWTSGAVWQYTYTGSDLSEVSALHGRKIQFVYYSGLTGSDAFKNSQLWRIGDHATTNLSGTPVGRYVEFDYQPEMLNGAVITNPQPLLSQVRDLRGETWTYTYYGDQSGETNTDLVNFLDGRLSPQVDTDGNGVADTTLTLESLTYGLDTQGDVSTIQQSRGDGLLVTDYAFNITVSGNRTKTTETVQSTNSTVTHYFENGVFVETENPATAKISEAITNQYRPAARRDANDNVTIMEWSDDGKHMQRFVDAIGNAMAFDYDSQDRQVELTTAEGRKTEYVYGDSANPRKPTEVKVIDVNGVDVLQWQQFTYDALGHTLEERLLDPVDTSGNTLLRKSTWVYGTTGNGNGLLESATTHDLIDPANNTSVTYTYDSIGRVIKKQKASLFGTCQFNFTVYDPSDKVIVTACSTHDVTGDVTEANIDALRSTYPDGTTVTKYIYDAMGRRTQTITHAGTTYERIGIEFYDSLNRVTRTIANYVDQGYAAPGNWVFENGVWKDGVGGIGISHGVDYDENIINDTAYNARGHLRLTRDVFGVVTLFGYDAADHLVKTVVNASSPSYDNDYIAGDPDLSAYPALISSDQDMISEQVYDPAGNVVQETDVRGAVTFSVYDALNRPVKVVRNAKSTATVSLNSGDTGYDAANDPRSTDYVISTDPDRDQIEITEYDKLGRVIRSQTLLENRFGEELWTTTLYGYNALGRRSRTISVASIPDYNIYGNPDLSGYPISTNPDEDIVTDTVYDIQGRVRYTINSQGVKTWNVYDGLNRTTRQVRNATETGGSPEDAGYLGDLNDPAADIMTETFYDADGRVQRTRHVLRTNGAGTDLEWAWTLYGYDTLGRHVRTIRNAANPNYFSAYADPDLSAYGTNVGFSINDDEDILSEKVYDSRGRVYQSVDRMGSITLYGYDEAGRQVKMVVNASNPGGSFSDDLSDYTGSNPDTDQDRIGNTEYGLGGRVISMTSTDGNVTRYIYDSIGRQVRSVANYIAQGTTDPADWVWSDTNSHWEDGAGIAIDHGTAFDQNQIVDTVYNNAGQVVSTRDPRGTVTAMSYDSAGRRQTTTAADGTSLARTNYIVYDKAGRVLRTITNWIDDGNSPDAVDTQGSWVFDPTSHGTNNDQNLINRFVYDNVGRITQRIDPMGHMTTTNYRKDGRIMEMTDPETTTTAYRYDALNRRVRVVAGYDDQLQTTDPADWVWNQSTSQWEES